MTEKTLYIHIGIGKTGTTAIQKFCFENRDLLREYGFRYAETGIDYYAHHILGHLWGVGWMQPEEVERRRQQANWQLLREEYEREPDSLLVSTESLARAFSEREQSLQELAAVLQGLPVCFIVYLRRQDLHVESWYNQLIKTGLSAEQFVPEQRTPSFYDYHTLLEKIRAHFPAAAVRVKVYEKEQFAGSTIFDDFLSILAVQRNDRFVLPQADPNPAIDLKTLEYLRLANGIERPWTEKYQFNLAVIAAAAASCDQSQPREVLMDPERRRRFLARYEESNARVARDYLGREDGKLFFEPTDNMPDATALMLQPKDLVALNIAVWQHMRAQPVAMPESTGLPPRRPLSVRLRSWISRLTGTRRG